ncbi:MAG: substrate-binding domain-containing protein, partial [Anaerolineaceae bacterium]|nr:substrate-binding domain-containing protein [Anaerolineaceae bacterium]
LSQQRSKTIGYVTDPFGWMGPVRLLAGVTYACDQREYSVLVKEFPIQSVEQVQGTIQHLVSHQVEGLIWAVAMTEEVENCVREQLDHLMIPSYFLTADECGDPRAMFISNREGVRQAITHLVECGYRHIGHIAGTASSMVGKARQQAWEDISREYGLPVEAQCWFEGDWTPSSGMIGLAALRAQYPQVDAVLAANDYTALGLLQAAQQQGIRIPEDLAVVGYDGLRETEYYQPALTTVAQDMMALGTQTALAIINLIENDQTEQKPISIAPQMVIRESTGRAGVLSA